MDLTPEILFGYDDEERDRRIKECIELLKAQVIEAKEKATEAIQAKKAISTPAKPTKKP